MVNPVRVLWLEVSTAVWKYFCEPHLRYFRPIFFFFFENIATWTGQYTDQFFLWKRHKWLLGPPETLRVEAQCHFVINFTTQFHKLHIMRDSKTPVKQPLSLGGANPSPPLKTWPILWFVNVFERKPRQKKIKAILITKTGIHHFWWKTNFKPNLNFKQICMTPFLTEMFTLIETPVVS